MKIIFNFLVLFIFFIPSISNADEINHGEFGEFVRSLNTTKDSYEIIADPTGEAPSKVIEKFNLKNGTCSKNPTWDDCKNDRERIELKQRNSIVSDSQIVRYEWSFYVEKNFPNVWPVKLSIAQFYDEKADRPAWMFQVNNIGLQIENLFSKKSPPTTLISNADLRGHWHHVRLEVRWSKDNGFFNVWVNDSQKLKYVGPTLISDSYFFKYGLYRSYLKRWTKKTVIPNQVIYFSNVKMTKNKKEETR